MRPVECKKCGHSFINNDDNKINIICPSCNIDYCNKNDTERNLFKIQEFYIDKRISKDVFISKIYDILIEYTKSLILKSFRFRLRQPEDLEYYARQAVHYSLIYFLEDDTFHIVSSFSGMIFHKIRQALNEKEIHDCAELTLDFLFDDEHKVEYEDTAKDVLSEIEDYEDKYILFKYIKNLIFAMDNICNDKRENFIRLMAIHHYIKYGEKKVDELFKNYSHYGKIKYEETLRLLHKELKRLYNENN